MVLLGLEVGGSIPARGEILLKGSFRSPNEWFLISSHATLFAFDKNTRRSGADILTSDWLLGNI